MSYRKFDTSTWQDPWFEQLDPNCKLAFLYLWSNDYCTQSGIYKVTQKRFEFDTGLKMIGTVDNLLPKVEWFKDINTVWVKNFFKHQCQSPTFAVGALNHIGDREMLKLFIDYNIKVLESYEKLDLNKYIISDLDCKYDTDTI